MILRRRATIERLDQYLAEKDYTSALQAITAEVKRKPENFNLLLRQAEILGMAGNRTQAVAVYRDLARFFARQGFYARALAVISKLERLDPDQQEATRELADMITAQQESERRSQERLRQATASAGIEHPKEPAPAVQTAGQSERERSASRLFAEFPAEALEELLASTSVRSFGGGDTVCREGEPGESMFLLVEGAVEVVTSDASGEPLVLAVLSTGDFFGEVALVTGRPRTATVRSQGTSVTLEITRQQVEAMAARHPGVRETLERFCRERAHATVEAMVNRMRGLRA